MFRATKAGNDPNACHQAMATLGTLSQWSTTQPTFYYHSHTQHKATLVTRWAEKAKAQKTIYSLLLTLVCFINCKNKHKKTWFRKSYIHDQTISTESKGMINIKSWQWWPGGRGQRDRTEAERTDTNELLLLVRVFFGCQVHRYSF